MKKNILISIVVIIIASTGFASYQYFSSFKDVTFAIKQSGLTVAIYNLAKNDQKISSLTGDGHVSLQNGDYYYVASGPKVDASHHEFTVDDSTKTVTINPDYSTDYLTSVLADEQVTIQAVITAAYPAAMSHYAIFSQQLFQKGDWYGGLLKYQTTDPNDIRDPYRVILHNQNGHWVLVHYPEIVVTQKDFPTVPLEILTSVNKLLDS